MTSANTNSPDQHKYYKVVVVVLENHGYKEIIGKPDSKAAVNAPYINGTLAKDGILITNAYGEQHPSQPNYFWLFSGSNQGIYYDKSYWRVLGQPPGPVFDTPNLYIALETTVGAQVQHFFGGYVDSPLKGSDMIYYPDSKEQFDQNPTYANRHVPWLGFKNINNGKPAEITRNFGTEFPIPTRENPEPAYDLLPLVSFVIPALNHDMHDYTDNFGNSLPVGNSKESSAAISQGDTWLENNLGGYAEWAKNNNSLLIITFDEDSTADWITPKAWGGNGTDLNPYGMTSPGLGFKPKGGGTISGPNQIAMLFYGANLAGTGPMKVPGVGVNNINLLRTIESFYNLPQSGMQTALAISTGLTNGPIEGIFTFDLAHSTQANSGG